jgi:hypothetical protein
MKNYCSPLELMLILPKGGTGALEAKGNFNSWAMETMKEV